MNIILVSSKLAKTKSITITHTQLAVAMVLLFMFMFFFAGWMYSLVVRAVPRADAALVMAPTSGTVDPAREQARMMDNVNALAMKLGEMQAQLLRLDSFGERLARLVGIKPHEFKFSDKPGRGGPAPTSGQAPTLQELNRQVEELSHLIEDRADKLGVLDSLLLDDRLKQKALPTAAPLAVGYMSSNYGYRLDPFTGRNAFHAGLDFVAPPGTPFTAAAGGIVAVAERHSEYGNMIEIDHGNGLRTRYGHAMKLLVKAGDIVLQGQEIGQVGNTGRSTGPHLHFEVRDDERTLDPLTFLHLDG